MMHCSPRSPPPAGAGHARCRCVRCRLQPGRGEDFWLGRSQQGRFRNLLWGVRDCRKSGRRGPQPRAGTGDTPTRSTSPTLTQRWSRNALWQDTDPDRTPRATAVRSRCGYHAPIAPCTSGRPPRPACRCRTTSRSPWRGRTNWRTPTTSRSRAGRHFRWGPERTPRQREAPRLLGGGGGRLGEQLPKDRRGQRRNNVSRVTQPGVQRSPLRGPGRGEPAAAR